jgi:hypothetical protein
MIRVDLDKAANVQLLDDTNFAAFRHAGRYRYHGGYYKQTPVNLVPPRTARWHVVVHLGGYAGTVRASVSMN